MSDRPPLFRPTLVVATVAVGLGSAAALLSDRVPGWFGLAQDQTEPPSWLPWRVSDGMLHVLIWTGLTLLACLAVRKITARLVVAGSASLAALALEGLQALWTSTRDFELHDVNANTWGVLIGLLLGIAAGGALDAYEARRRRRGDA